MRQTVARTEIPNDDVITSRKYLHPEEVRRLIDAAGKVGRQGQRDRLLITLLYRHGLRLSEATALRWADFDFHAPRGAILRVRRLKGSRDSVHTLEPDESRMVRAYRLTCPVGASLVFYSERGGPLSAPTVQRIVARAGGAAGLGHVHPHQLRHSAGFMLANEGVSVLEIAAYLGHRNIQNTVGYAELSAARLAQVRVR